VTKLIRNTFVTSSVILHSMVSDGTIDNLFSENFKTTVITGIPKFVINCAVLYCEMPSNFLVDVILVILMVRAINNP